MFLVKSFLGNYLLVTLTAVHIYSFEMLNKFSKLVEAFEIVKF